MTVNHAEPCDLVSPRNCFHCGQALTVSAPVTSECDVDVDYGLADDADADAGSGTIDHVPARVTVSDPSLVSSRSSTPLDVYMVVPPLPPPVPSSDDDCASLLSSDVGGDYASSDDLDSEYVSAMEVPELQVNDDDDDVTGGTDHDSADTFNDLYDANDELDVSSLDDDDGDDDDDSGNVDPEDGLAPNSTLTGGDTLQESSNSASTLLEYPDDILPRDTTTTQSSSEDDSDEGDEHYDDGVFGAELTLLADVSDDADGDDNCLAPGNNPTEPLLAPAAGDSDFSDAN